MRSPGFFSKAQRAPLNRRAASLSGRWRSSCQTWRRTLSRAAVPRATTWNGSQQMTALVACPGLRADLSNAGPMSIETASMASERCWPSSSKKQSRVAVSLPALPHTNRPVACELTNVTYEWPLRQDTSRRR